MTQYVAFSGGHDSTAMALRMHELGESAALLFTPARNEPADLFEHVHRMRDLLGWELIEPPAPTLESLIELFNALPNHQQRWCTRMIKIQPCDKYLREHPGSTLCVGLRADEAERGGIYGDCATYRYPLREWGWDDPQVLKYLRQRGVKVPKRTNCEWCYGQRIGEWYDLWKTNPQSWAAGEREEEIRGHTFRSPSRDTWPASMKDLRAEFESGRKLRGQKVDLTIGGNLFDDVDIDTEEAPCRACSF